MINGVITILTLVSAVAFPWQLTAVLALVGSLSIPLLPLAAGIFLDAIYFTHGAAAMPMFSVFGALATVAAYFVQARLTRGIID